MKPDSFSMFRHVRDQVLGREVHWNRSIKGKITEKVENQWFQGMVIGGVEVTKESLNEIDITVCHTTCVLAVQEMEP